MKDVNLLLSNGVNVQESLSIFGDIETYNESLETFNEEVKEKLNRINSYKEAGDMSNYAIQVHSLKTDAKYFGFTKLAELAYEHEMASKENKVYLIYENYEELIKETSRIVNLVKEYLGEEVVKESIDFVLDEFQDKTILVVDDSNVIQNLIKKIFDNKFHVILASDGKEAIEIIETERNIQGMLLDLNMPNVDGFGVLDYFTARDLFESIPVAVVTGVDDQRDIDRANTYSIVEVLKKPFNERDIKKVVEKMLDV